MNTLPVVISNIIIDYKYQLEHKEKFSKCMNELKEKVWEYYIDEEEDDGYEITYSVRREAQSDIEVHYELCDGDLECYRTDTYDVIVL